MPDAAVPLYPYQQRWLLDKGRFKIGMFSRQSGKTFTTTLECVDDCFAAASERAGRRERWVILSRGERQAAEAMEEGVKRHAAAYSLAMENLDHEFVAESGTRYKALEVGLPGGSRITALPANPETARGYSANVFLDEFARHQKSREIWGSLFPVISAGHRIRVTSTPNGKGNKFYELMTADEQIWSQHVVDIHQAVADGLPRNIEELRAGLNDDELWRQEYELEWLDEASAWLSFDLINGMEHPLAGDPRLVGRNLTVIGNDIGRRRDLWVAWVLELVGDVAWTREVVELRNKKFAEHDMALDALAERYRPAAIWMDQTGMGEKPVEDAIGRYGESIVNGCIFSAPRRLDLATALRTRAQDRKVRIPAGNRQLRADLHAVKRMAGQIGSTPRLVVVDDAGEANSHADRFWALALACGALEGRVVEFGYRPVRPASDSRGRDDDLDDDDDRRSDRWGRYASAAADWRAA